MYNISRCPFCQIWRDCLPYKKGYFEHKDIEKAACMK